MNNQSRKQLIIVKVGTNLLANHERTQERLNDATFDSIGKEVRELSDAGHGVILVSSGAITAGVFADKKHREDIVNMAEERRYAARGWDRVVQRWKQSIGETRVSSTLLTKRELADESMRAKLLEVMDCCLAHNDIFVVNENDCLSDDEIKYGDNDTLAAAIAVESATSGLFRSVKLVLLTNKNGLNKVASDDNTIIRVVDDIASVESYAGGAANGHSRGGMATKVQAAKTAKQVGVETYIAHGETTNAVQKALSREIGTHFTL